MAARGTGRCETDPDVTAGRLDDDGVVVQVAHTFGAVEHRGPDAVFHRVRRTERVDRPREVVGKRVEPYERCIADFSRDVVCDFYRPTVEPHDR